MIKKSLLKLASPTIRRRRLTLSLRQIGLSVAPEVQGALAVLMVVLAVPALAVDLVDKADLVVREAKVVQALAADREAQDLVAPVAAQEDLVDLVATREWKRHERR